MFELLCFTMIVAVGFWYLYYSHCLTYWKKRGLQTYPGQFPFGNMRKTLLGKEHVCDTIQTYYESFKKDGQRHAGLYSLHGPVYFPIDPEIIKHIMSTDFDHFTDRGMFIDDEKFPLAANIFLLPGHRWKPLRQKLTATFSAAKLRNTFEIFSETMKTFVDALEIFAVNGEDINIKKWSSYYTADLISKTALGIESTILKNPDSELIKNLERVLNPSVWLMIQTVVFEGLQNPGKLARALLSDTRVTIFFTSLIKNIIKYRKNNNIVRHDLMSVLITNEKNEALTFKELIGQSFVFFLGGFETSSHTISFALHELAHNQALQDKLRREIETNIGLHYEKYTLDNILSLPYLDKVFKETTRMYPVFGVFHRICVKKYKIPGTDVIIEKGTPVLIPARSLQLDPDYFPNPFEFNPERFSCEDSIKPFTFMPFGEGPRYCIGARYGTLQTKMAIAALISQFRFHPSSGTPRYIELDKITKTPAMAPKKGIHIKITKL